MKNIFKNIKNYFKDNKTKSITILVVLILTIISSITLIAYSFYQNKSTKLIISGLALIDSSDVSIKVYRENKNDNGVGIGTYSLSYYVPSASSYSYVESKSVCDTGIAIEKYENQKFYVDATKKGKCKVYFDAIDGYIDDYEVNLFVQNEIGNTDDKNYNQMGQLPLYETGYYYTINESKTSCTNGATVSIAGRNIVVLTTQKAVCNVYADKNSDNQAPVISSLSISDTTVTFTATDNISLAFYGVSDSNAIEPEEYNSFSGTSQTISFTQNAEGTYYLWVKDSAGNIATKEFTISLGTSFETLMVANNTDIFNENGIRYEGADPNNYICLDSNKEGACSSSSLLFRIIGLFEEEYSSDGTTSAGKKNLLKILDTNNYGEGEQGGMTWDMAQYPPANDWSKSVPYTVLNGTYLSTLLATSGVNSKLRSAIVISKWHLGGANATSSSKYYYRKITTENYYKAERSPYATSGTLQNLYSGNPEYVFAKVGLMYPSDYGYATVGGSTTSKANCRSQALYNWGSSSYSDCKNNDWVFKSATFFGDGEWFISSGAMGVKHASGFRSTGLVDANIHVLNAFAVRPSFYLDSSILKIVGTGDGTKDNAYRLG